MSHVTGCDIYKGLACTCEAYSQDATLAQLREVNKELTDRLNKAREREQALRKALEGMVKEFGFDRHHPGMVHDEMLAILHALEALKPTKE